jgi:hypothetical protein
MINLNRRYVFAFYMFRNGWSNLKMFELPHQSNGAIKLIRTRAKTPRVRGATHFQCFHHQHPIYVFQWKAKNKKSYWFDSRICLLVLNLGSWKRNSYWISSLSFSWEYGLLFSWASSMWNVIGWEIPKRGPICLEQ